MIPMQSNPHEMHLRTEDELKSVLEVDINLDGIEVLVPLHTRLY